MVIIGVDPHKRTHIFSNPHTHGGVAAPLQQQVPSLLARDPVAHDDVVRALHDNVAPVGCPVEEASRAGQWDRIGDRS